MNIKPYLKYVWLACATFSLILLGFHWFGFDSPRLKIAILALNAASLLLSMPCCLFFIPVAAAANHFMGLWPLSDEGIYLNTLLLFVVGAMQWFWIAQFWSPAEPDVQELGLSGL